MALTKRERSIAKIAEMEKKTLLEKAKEFGVVGRHDMNKQQLAEQIYNCELRLSRQAKKFAKQMEAKGITAELQIGNQIASGFAAGAANVPSEDAQAIVFLADGVAGEVVSAAVVSREQYLQETANATLVYQKPPKDKRAIREGYINKAPMGTLIAFKLKSGKVISAALKKRNIAKRKLMLETKYEEEFIVSYDAVVWVRTHKYWPSYIFRIWKGEETREVKTAADYANVITANTAEVVSTNGIAEVVSTVANIENQTVTIETSEGNTEEFRVVQDEFGENVLEPVNTDNEPFNSEG